MAIARPPAAVTALTPCVIIRANQQAERRSQMSLPKEQLQMIERLLNLLGVQVLDADIINEREVTIQVGTAGYPAVRHKCGQKAAEFRGYGVRLRPHHFQVFDRRSYLRLRPNHFGRRHCYDRPTTTHLDDW
jgi:hypothetical protein